MIDSITVAESGLRGFEQGLLTISNNTANLNTPGFKGATTQFADLFYGNNMPASGGSGTFGRIGHGMSTLGTQMNFAQGQLQSTGNPLDLAMDGQGYFTLKDSKGAIHYTADGQFKFDASGTLIATTTGEQVMALDPSGALVPVTLNNQMVSPAKSTSRVVFSGNVSSTATVDTVGSITVIDGAGTSHTLTLTLAPVAGASGQWNATLKDGTTVVGTQTLAFKSGQVVPASSQLSYSYTPANGAAVPLTFDFSSNVTSFDTGTSSSLAVATQDGYATGNLTGEAFDASGTLVLSYSNGKTSRGAQLALAQFRSADDVQAIGNNEFSAVGGNGWLVGVAGQGQFGTLKSGTIETSNVDLSREFSNLVIMQRGYQACSQVVSTASDMLTTLFGMWNK